MRTLLVFWYALLGAGMGFALETPLGPINSKTTLNINGARRVEVSFSSQGQTADSSLGIVMLQSNGLAITPGEIPFSLLNQVNNFAVIHQAIARRLIAFIPTVLSTLLISNSQNIPQLNQHCIVNQVQMINGQLMITISGYNSSGVWVSLDVAISSGTPGLLQVSLHTGFFPIVHTIDLILQPVHQIQIPLALIAPQPVIPPFARRFLSIRGG